MISKIQLTYHEFNVSLDYIPICNAKSVPGYYVTMMYYQYHNNIILYDNMATLCYLLQDAVTFQMTLIVMPETKEAWLLKITG